MTINERMFKYMSEKGIKAAEIARKLNINENTISNWKKRGNNPPLEYAIPICEVLEISINKLLGVDEADEGALSSDEKKIISYFRNCSDKDKKILLTICEDDSQQEHAKSSISKTG